MTGTIYGESGKDAWGAWGHLIFDTEEKAQEYADSVTKDMTTEGVWTEEGGAEPYWLEPPPSPEEIESTVEQSFDYFNRHVAGDW